MMSPYGYKQERSKAQVIAKIETTCELIALFYAPPRNKTTFKTAFIWADLQNPDYAFLPALKPEHKLMVIRVSLLSNKYTRWLVRVGQPKQYPLNKVYLEGVACLEAAQAQHGR